MIHPYISNNDDSDTRSADSNHSKKIANYKFKNGLND
jgi:hypothetical protein